jgi:predicted transcriptional regulator
MQTARTTIELDKELLKRVKQKALEEDKNLKQLITEALKKELLGDYPKKRKVKFKATHLGVSGTLRREEIYDWL